MLTSHHRIRTSSRIRRKQTILSIGSSSHYYLAKPPPNPHRRLRNSQERAGIYIYTGMRTGDQARAAHRFCWRIVFPPCPNPDRECYRPCSTPATGKLCQIWLVRMPRRWNATILSLANRCSFRCAKLTFLSKFRLFLILNPMGP